MIKNLSSVLLIRRECKNLFFLLMALTIIAGCATESERQIQTLGSQNIEYNLGILAGIAGDFPQAKTRLTKAIPVDSQLGNDEMFSALALTVTEDVLNRKISPRTGSAMLKGVLGISIARVEGQSDRTNLRSAMVEFKKAIAANPRYAIAHFALGLYYFYTNYTDLAKHEFQKSIAIDPKLGIAHVHYALLQAMKGNNDSYQRHIETAIGLVDSKTNTLGSRVPSSITTRLEEYRRDGRRLPGT